MIEVVAPVVHLRRLRLVLIAVAAAIPLIPLIRGVFIHLMRFVVSEAAITRGEVSVDVYAYVDVALRERRLHLLVLASLVVVIAHKLLLRHLVPRVHALIIVTFVALFLVS